jgi:DNA-binding response OmpR family regulator
MPEPSMPRSASQPLPEILDPGWLPKAEPVRVLVATADPSLRTAVSRRLRLSGFAVAEAETAADALERLSAGLLAWPPWQFDILVADADLPGQGGMELLAGLRHEEWEIPVILITDGEDDARREALRLGAFATMKKPFDVEELDRAVLELAWQTASRFEAQRREGAERGRS